MIIGPGVTIGGAITIADPNIPTLGNTIAWTDGTYANVAGVGSGITTSSLASTNNMCWQLFYAWRTVTIPAQANGVGIDSTTTNVNNFNYYVTVASAIPGVNDFYSTPVQITSQGSTNYTAGVLCQTTTTVSTTIPAGCYFMIGVSGGPYTRAFQTATQNNTFSINGVPYVTALNTVYYGPWPSGPTSGVPTQVGGTTSGYVTYTSNVSVISVVFQ